MTTNNQLTIKGFFHRDDVKSKFNELMGNRSAQFITSVLSVVNNNSYLKNASPESVFSAAMMAATLDLPVNPNLGFAYIIPYGQSAQFQVGYKGLVQLATVQAEKLKGGNGLLYSASVIGFMSKSKLKTGEEDDMDLGQSGISVLFKTQKNRLAKPKKIRFDISFLNGLNPYTGLDAFCRPEYFNQIGIAQGKAEVDKSTGEFKFTPGGNRWYVSHLDKSFTTKQLFTPEIFTQEVLEKMAPIVNDYFRFKSLDEVEAVEKKFNEMIGEEDDSNGFTDASDADDIFG